MKILRSRYFVVIAILLVCLSCLIFCLFAVAFLVQLFDRITTSPSDLSGQKTFYTSTGAADYRRMALIEPYQAISINGSTWSVELFTGAIRYQPSVNDIEEIAVIDQKYIITHSLNTLYSGNRVNELWFVIVPATKVEKGFVSQADLLTFLQLDVTTVTSKLSQGNDLYAKLLQQGYLEWFPSEYKK